MNAPPDKSNFDYERLASDNSYAKVKVTWRPNISAGNPGSHFYVQYRKVGEPSFEKTNPEVNEDFTSVGGLEPNQKYEFQVVAVDGKHEVPSASQIIETPGDGELSDKAMHQKLIFIDLF